MRYYNQTVFKPAIAGCFAGFIVLGIIYLYGFGLERFKPEAIRNMMLSLGYWGPLLYIICNIVRPLFFFPAAVLAVGGGLAFGPVWGTIYLVIGTAGGAALCFGAARLLGRDRLTAWPKWAVLEELDNQAASHGFRTVLLLRLAPVIPWDAVSFLAGLSKVSFRPYVLATLVGSVPGAIAFSCFGNILFKSMPLAVLVAVTIVIMSFSLQALCRGRKAQ
ncbi:SNARE associated protein [uncultured Sporomusa sp.]|uniref:TVP38/TMEM64 family membrane protein n=1 Tax=uncultured Sporomusa sp. TaxID=307249 RepID=A0A212LMF3_9FIRM|nr:TVP38/TMEM64 family protein [uncultured Sporomusa sp.]SCM78701.1 SNARE associated protein [uncultured Sporomusa sp.]